MGLRLGADSVRTLARRGLCWALDVLVKAEIFLGGVSGVGCSWAGWSLRLRSDSAMGGWQDTVRFGLAALASRHKQSAGLSG